MTRQSLTIMLPDKTFRVTSTWVVQRDGPAVHIWASAGDHRKGAKAAVHSQCFGDEGDARGACHLLSEAVIYAHACGDGRIDLRGFCFWDDPGSGKEPPDEAHAEVNADKPRPEGITLSSLFTRNRT